MKKKFFAFVLAMNAFFSWAQNIPQFPAYNYNLVPPSPEVASLAKFGEHNLSYATGKPTISVPLYTIKSGSLTVPVSLDYSPGGIRVDEISSSAGLGWALSAGGMISRTVVGMGDDYPVNGFLDNEDYAPVPLYNYWVANLGTGAGYDIFYHISNNDLDVEPDKYFFNLPGKAGGFTINVDDEKVYTIPFEKMNIAYERTPVAGFTEIFTRWIVTTPDGVRYVYGRRMNNEQTVYSEANLNVRTDVRTQSRSETTAWFLREMISADNADTVVFNYTAYNTGYCNQLSITKRLSPLNQYDCLLQEERSYSRNDVSSYIISEITGRFGKVEFTYEDNRQDLHGGKRLRYVTVFNRGSQQTQKFELVHSYFTSNKYPPLIPIPCPSNYTGSQSQRLKLDSLKEVAVSGQVLTRKFTYDYNEQTGRILPNRLSNAQDDWGYYNGINNTTLVPRYPAYAAFDVLSSVLDGAIREPSENFTKIGMLTGITYPTGGRTVYEYEQNDAWGRDFLHEVALPNENIPYVEYARLESNTALDPGFPGFQLESAPFTVNNSTYQRPFSYFQIGFNHPNYQVGGCDYESHGAQPCRIGVYLIDVTNNTSTTIAPGSLIRLLLNSVYKLRMQVMDKTEYSADAVAYVKGPATHPGFYNKKIGGLRIKTISDYDGSSLDPVLKKRYKYLETDGTTSSGKLNFYPSYHSSVHYSHPGEVGGDEGQGCHTNVDVFQRTANSFLPLTTFAGSPVTYSRVEAYQEGNGTAKLKSVYQFTSEGDIWGTAVDYPFPPPTSLEHRRGLPTLEEHFKQTGTGYDIVSSKQTIYRQWCLDQDGAGNPCPNMKWHYGAKIVPVHYQISTGNNSGVNLYKILTEWVAPEETRERTYSSPTTYIEKKTTYSYDNPSHAQITQVKAFESNSDKTIADFKYTDDYADFTSSSDLQANAIKNIKNKKGLFPIEKLTIRENQAGDKFVTGGSILYYKSTSIRPDALYSLDVFNPIPLTSFTRSYIDGSGVFIKDSRYRKFATYVDYDVYGNVTNTNKENDINYAYIFDYNGLYPVCQVKDAATQQIAYTSFEAENKGYWTYSGTPSTQSNVPTGEKAYMLSSGNTLTRSGLSSSTVYVVSYWKKGGSTPYTVSGNQSGGGYPISGITVGDWTHIKHRVTGVTSVSISSASDGWIDEVRLYPLGAQMQTYTYDPLIGMLTQSDQNDRITYYDYDEFNRLRLVRDYQWKILKKFCYNYFNQPEECGVPGSPQWVSTGETRCQLCPSNNNYLSGIQEHREVDNNSSSPTYGSERWVSDGIPGSCSTTPDWQNTSTALRCRLVGGIYTSEREQEQTDMNPCTNQGTRWIIVDQNCSACPKPATWQITGNLRCVTSGGNNTGVQEREERNTESCSPTYNQTRWVSVGTNCSSCPKPANWQVTGNYRCVTSGGNNTSEQEREEKDMELCSATYNQTRWVSVGTNCTTCPKPPVWQVTGNLRCVTSGGNNTGEQEREERNTESCSPTYNQTRWVSVGTNCTTCAKPASWQSTGNYRCVKDGSNNNTGQQEREERDMESCSATYNQTRWVSNSTNCSNCPKPASWQPTGNLRCVKDGNNNNTGTQEREEKDMESCSATYNQTRWVAVGTNCSTCPKPASWQATGNLRCVKDASNNNTGEQEREEKDMESCSATYNQTRWVSNGVNAFDCPFVVECNTSNCTGEGRRCIGGRCRLGVKVYTSSVYNSSTGMYDCYYHYEWSSGTIWSHDYYQQSATPCL